MNTDYTNFLTYVRTLQLFKQRLKGIDESTGVYISQKEIETKFFIYPQYNRKEVLKELVSIGELQIIEGKSNTSKRKYITYRALKQGEIDISLIKSKKDNFDNIVIKQMRDYLKNVSLKKGSESTVYFDAFLKHKDSNVSLFFTVDNFARRVHTPITNFHRELRGNILLFNNKLASLDVATMQPILLGKILNETIGENEYSNWINSGKDIYVMLQHKAGLKTRDQAKKRFFEILFAPPSNSLSEMFGASDWINWINDYKSILVEANPHSKNKHYTNLAWLLQSTEVSIMYKVWTCLFQNSIPFLSVHDEILIEEYNEHRAKWLFNRVLSSEFEYYKLNSKIKD